MQRDDQDTIRFGPEMLARLRAELLDEDDGGRPDFAGGVPMCALEECPQYDGKRCRVLGMRPDAICEPAVIDMAATIERYARAIAAADQLAEAVVAVATCRACEAHTTGPAGVEPEHAPDCALAVYRAARGAR